MSIRKIIATRFSLILLWAPFGAFCQSTVFADDAADVVDFNRDIRPLLSSNCLACHGPDEENREADLRLDTQVGSRSDLGGHAAIVPGDHDASELFRRITTDDENERMPPVGKGKRFSQAEIEVVKKWILQGANYQEHWSYTKPIRPEVPEIREPGFAIQNPIDAFVLRRLEQEKLSPSPAADRLTLARRVALDLTGLPPTWDEAQAFVEDSRGDAYERYVDAQLSKPAFGERWASVWLDLARYADSSGYADDPPRTIWAYRDWVIRAFHQNKPFDEFTIEQIAGDLLDDPTDDQLIATAFHRNSQTNNEGGTNDEEFRNVAIVDRVNTTMEVWMGTTMACAQCHTHKYDPITQAEYFQLFDFFNQSEDADRGDERPLIEIWEDNEQPKQRNELQRRIARLERQLKNVESKLTDTAEQELSEEREEIASLKKQLDSIRPITTVPIMRDLEPRRERITKVQVRGNYKNTAEQVKRATPAVFHPLRQDLPPNRLALAHWLVDPENPLTARVIVNRFWEQIFGSGLVLTNEEFGSQGDLPSHPEMLDWLAVEFQTDWDVKRLLKLLVMSSSYRQVSRMTPELLDADPTNRLYARGPRFRVTSEMVRDQALFVSGLLSENMYGVPVNPPQPQLGLKAAFGGETDWKTSSGDDKFRRGIYTTWRRSSPYPSMSTFDSPSREVCTSRRGRTNTPLQALVTLNDPVYIEAAQALARKIDMQGGDSIESKIAYGIRTCLVREPTDEETAELVRLYRTAVDRFSQQPDQAKLFAEEPLGKIPHGSDPVDLAAWTVVSNVLLNLDEMFLKR